ncbi:MAG: rhodanese-like domain-containing protein [Chloroflexi bacterium CFX4]|nr:rhodanese-like domain-containing protein [Chloroflexi bacterium CFX4]MDL1921909.1 rhodanese-like domain-containing protein [Chloroflexi bacterium CFX3]
MSHKKSAKHSANRANRAKPSAQHNGQALVIFGAGILIVVAALLVGIFVSGGGAATTTASADAVQGGVISPSQYVAQFSNTNHLLLDVRTVGEFASGHIGGAANIPVEELANRLAEVPNDQPIVIYCRSGNRSAQAARILRSAGYAVVYDLGGIITWQAQGYPVQQ